MGKHFNSIISVLFICLLALLFQNCSSGGLPDVYTGGSNGNSSSSEGPGEGNEGGGDNDSLEMSDGAYRFENNSAAQNCHEYINASQYDGEGNGLYWIDPDGAGGDPALKAYCDMTIDGGGWTLLTNRPADTDNIEACGNNTNEFIQDVCGDVGTIGINDSYSLGGGADRRNDLRVENEWLVISYGANATADTDDAYIIVHDGDLFPSTTTFANIGVTAVCNIAGDCDTTDVFWRYVGDGTIALSECSGNHFASTTQRGTYGYCPDGLGAYITNQSYGDRQGFNEMKLWGQDLSAGKDWQERVFVR